MPLDNSLNVSELLRRIGVKGDSLGSAPLLESMRMSLIVGDLSQLVPPLMGPIGGGSIIRTGGAGNRNKWSLQARSAGGLRILSLRMTGGGSVRLFVTPVNVLGVQAVLADQSFSFGQPVQSFFTAHIAAAATAAPVNSPEMQQGQQPGMGWQFPNWIGPSEFFNIEGEGVNQTEEITIWWMEYPGALNPG